MDTHELALNLLNDHGYTYRHKYDRKRLAKLKEFIDEWGVYKLELTTNQWRAHPRDRKKLEAWERIGSIASTKEFLWVTVRKESKRRYLM